MLHFETRCLQKIDYPTTGGKLHNQPNINNKARLSPIHHFEFEPTTVLNYIRKIMYEINTVLIK